MTEDLHSKRQLWHCEGDLPQILMASFAMPFFMEPVNFELPDKAASGKTENSGNKAKLIDSGTIDLASLGVAAKFSSNLLVSSAFYDKKVNLNNPLTILSRSFSIGKERTAVKDIFKYEPILIRNNVENFYFMDFQKIAQITQAGYESATSMIGEVLRLPHGSKPNADTRQQHEKIAEKFIENIKRQPVLNSQKFYANAKVWPQFGITDFPDSYLFDMYGLALSAFLEYKTLFTKVQANQPFTFDQTRVEAQLALSPTDIFSAQIFGSYGFDFTDFRENNFLGFAQLKLRPKQFPLWLQGFFVTAEAKSDFQFTLRNLLPDWA